MESRPSSGAAAGTTTKRESSAVRCLLPLALRERRKARTQARRTARARTRRTAHTRVHAHGRGTHARGGQCAGAQGGQRGHRPTRTADSHAAANSVQVRTAHGPTHSDALRTARRGARRTAHAAHRPARTADSHAAADSVQVRTADSTCTDPRTGGQRAGAHGGQRTHTADSACTGPHARKADEVLTHAADSAQPRTCIASPQR